MFNNIKKKQVILVRHANALERDEWGENDFDRPLTQAGENSNKIVANYLRLIGVKPDRIVASPAARTKATALGIAQKFNISTVEYDRDLYNEDVALDRDAMMVHMNVVKKNKRDCNILVIVGHNNDLSRFAGYLSNDGVPSMKKWSVIVLSLPEDMEWKNVTPGALKFLYYITPQFLRLESLV